MHSKIIPLLLLTIFTLRIESSVVPVAPSFRYTLITPPNIRPFAAQVSTFTKGLDVLSAPFAAGVLNPPAIVSKTIALPPGPAAPIALPAPIPAPVAAPPYLPAPVTAPLFYPAPISAPAPVAGPSFLPAPVTAPLFLQSPISSPALYAPPPHVLPVPNARSVHAVTPALEPTIW